MTATRLAPLYRELRDRLRDIPVEFPEDEALLLLRKHLGVNGRAELAARSDSHASPEQLQQLEQALEQRTSRPLQYILGSWEFDEMQLTVGEGVLVPRQDTMVLVESVCRSIESVVAPRILDLCAGTGAVGLAVQRRRPDAECVFVELSDGALPYLRKNVELFAATPDMCAVLQADVLSSPPDESCLAGGFDCICSNPPYIPSEEIATLSREVRQEPSMALDGGADGLKFYRAICCGWLPLMKHGGCLAVELGKGQETNVKEMFVRSDVANIALATDMSGVIRVIYGTIK